MNKLVSMVCGLVCAVVLLSGCEDNSVPEGAEFRIEPGQVTLSDGQTNAVLAVVGGNAPFIWHVSDPQIGQVSGVGPRVTYLRGQTNGVNTVIVVDGRKWTAEAIVVQQGTF